MEDLKVTNSLDWQKVRSELSKAVNNVPMFSHDIRRLLKQIDDQVTELSKIEVDYRRTHSAGLIPRMDEQKSKINEQIRTFNKCYLFALLAKD